MFYDELASSMNWATIRFWIFFLLSLSFALCSGESHDG